MIEYEGYTGVFEFDRELGLFTGHVVDLRDEIYFEGESVEALTASMKRAVDHYLEVCQSRGEAPDKPYSGKLNVRLGSDLHRAVAVAAAATGESINSWISRVLQAAAQVEGAAALGPKKPRDRNRERKQKITRKQRPA